MNNNVKNVALRILLDYTAQEGEIDGPRAFSLVRLGFNADALISFTHRCREQPKAKAALGDLARVIRHNSDFATWKRSLDQLSAAS